MLDEELLHSRLNDEYVLTFIDEWLQYCPKSATLILGHGRSGKDTLADILVSDHEYTYNETSSVILCEKLYPENPKLMYQHRHNYRMLLFEFGNLIRDLQPCFIPYCSLRNNSNLLVGLRSIIDIKAILPICDKVIWMNRDVPNDPTMDYTFDQLQRECSSKLIVFNNTKDYNFLRQQIELFL